MSRWWKNRWQRMGGMDVADVAYDAFLVNGERDLVPLPSAKTGERVRLRIINAGASSYFQLHSAGLDFEVIAADGLDVKPVIVDEILHAVAETYDVLVTVPDHGARELRVASQDSSGYASVWIGQGTRLATTPYPRPDLYADHSMHGSSSPGHDHAHYHHGGPRQLRYGDLTTIDAAQYLGNGPLREVELRLTGDMETYNWSFNDTPLSRADKILVERGEIVRFKFINETMMHHPLHLHGHFFRVLTDDEGGGPLKHTVNVPPLETVTIEFLANEEKDWFFHCHNLYHAKTGMARVVRYSDYSGNPDFDQARIRSADIKDTDFYAAGELKILSDFGRAEARISNNLHVFEATIESRNWDEDRGEANYGFRIDRWTQFLLGVEQEEGEEAHAKLGVRYVLPLLVDIDLYLTSEGKIEAEFETELQLAKRWQAHLEYVTTGRHHLGLEYRFDERWSAELAHTNHVGFALGVKLRL